MLIIRLLLCIVIGAICCPGLAQDNAYECFNPPVEIRGIWVDAASIPKTREGVVQLVQRLHNANVNVLFPEVITRGYTIYPSRLIARDPRFVGAPDVLAAMIRESHRLGMEVHPWVWVFRAGYTKDRGGILTAHPDWAELSSEGKELSPNGGMWISPCIPQARDFLAELLAELVSCYEVDGLHLDYVRYETEQAASYGYCDASRALFAKQYGYDPRDVQPGTISHYEWNKFRERQVNTFVQRIALQTRWIKPHVKISAAVAPEPRAARLELMQNWANWVDNKWVDFLCPMSYAGTEDFLGRLLFREKEAIGNTTLLASGIGFFQQKDPLQMVRQIGVVRQSGGAGQVLFSSYYLKDAHTAALKTPYAKPASLPFRDIEEKQQRLFKDSQRLAAQGRCEEASYLAKLSTNLEDYAKYQSQKIRYVPPTELPLAIQAETPAIDSSL